MAKSPKTSSAKAGDRKAKSGATYRGVRIQGTAGPARFTLDQIRHAVDAAVSKNADALDGRRKA